MAIATTLPVSRVVNVAVEMSPTAAALRNFGSCLILGDSDIIDTDERIRLYSSISDIATDFGISSREYLAAQAFFSQSPQPTQVYIGRWAKSATAGRLRGRTLSSAEQDISLFTAITTGTLSLTIDGASKSMASIDLSAETNLNGVASQISSALGVSGSCAWTGERFVITSATTGTSSTVATTDTGTLSSLMGFAGSATSVAGVAAESLSDDSIVEAAGLIEAASPSRMIGFTTQNSTEIDSTASSTLGSRLKGLGYNRTILVYSSDSPVAAASVFGRMATINFEGSNTTLTLKFKQLPGVTAENLRSSQAEALKSHNVNAFCAYQNDTSILQEGITSGGWFIDETHGLDWLQNRVETDLWNLLYTSKKVGQDESGATAIVSCVNKSLEQGVANGLIAPGVWNGDAFGALESGDTLSTGYYVYIQPFDEQSQSDREARKAPPIQIAVKLKGAVHFINVTITVNR